MNFGTVAILGPGLIGGSLALALAERGLAERLMIYARSPRALDEIRLAGVDAELTQNPSEAVREADVVILCVPIEAMAGLVHEFRDALKPDALVTDVGSVKGSVDREIVPLLKGRALWIGSHPMAGSEQAGFAAARADLFEGATVVVTRTQNTSSAALKRALKFWNALGSRTITQTPAQHDIRVAQISHLPHLLAAALVDHVQNAEPEALELVGGGFRDSTRIASGSADLWTEILSANANAVAHALQPFIKKLERLRDCLVNEDKQEQKQQLQRLLKDAQDVRSKISDRHKTSK
jgi:prephenate dehydrogenase